jgi:hypothetical protein
MVSACSTTGTLGETPDAGASSDAAADAPAPAVSYTLTFGPIQVAPNAENTQCLVLRLHNDVPIHVGAIHNLLGTSSHHMIVYRVNDTVEQTTPFACQPFTDTLDPTKGSAIMVSQKKDDLLTFPPGVAYTLDANQMIRIEMHYINATAATTTLQSTTTMIPLASGDYKYEADFLFIGDPDIKIPANSKKTLGPVIFPLPAGFETANFFAITGHEHKLGTGVTVSTTTSTGTSLGGAGTVTPVYDVPGWLWSEPATVTHDPPFTVPQGGGFQFQCDWDNTTANTVTFGESANNEMCFFWAYYYPSVGGARVCFHTDMVSGGLNLCCPGGAECSLVTQFLDMQQAAQEDGGAKDQ